MRWWGWLQQDRAQRERELLSHTGANAAAQILASVVRRLYCPPVHLPSRGRAGVRGQGMGVKQGQGQGCVKGMGRGGPGGGGGRRLPHSNPIWSGQCGRPSYHRHHRCW